MASTADRERKNLYYSVLEPSKIADGAFQGGADTTFVKAEVEVTVKDHTIIEIDLLKHENGKGAKAEAIIMDMINQNTYQVDSISGATLSSEVIKSAVSIALEQGKEQ
jgi:uncharacterized protein with FMN-binding domain